MNTAGFVVSFSSVIVASKMLLFLTFLFGGVLGDLPRCPPRESIFPCSCEKVPSSTLVSCSGLDNLDVVRPVLKNTRGQKLAYYFARSQLGNISSDFFEGQQSERLSFLDCQINSFGDRPFSGLENTLQTIYVGFNVGKTSQDLEAFPLGHLKKLQQLCLTGTAVTKVGNGWFKGGPKTVKYIILNRNNINELGDQTFASLDNVEYIELDSNPIKKVSRSMFPSPAAKLKTLCMSTLDIEELPEDIFEFMPNLKRVFLNNNKLKTIPYATWGKIWHQLEDVGLDNLDLECDYRMKWIYQQKLPKNLIGRCGGSNKLSGKKLSELRLEDFE